MINIKDISNMPVLFINEGASHSKIVDLIIDPERFAVRYAAVRRGRWYTPVRLIPYDKVLSIGNDMVAVMSETDVVDITKEMMGLMDDSASLEGAKIVDQTGNIRGNVAEFSIDEKTGRVMAIISVEGDVIQTEKIISLSSGIIVISDLN